MAEERAEDEKFEDPKGLREDAPDISGGLERGMLVRISARIGSDLSGYVCDRDAGRPCCSTCVTRAGSTPATSSYPGTA